MTLWRIDSDVYKNLQAPPTQKTRVLGFLWLLTVDILCRYCKASIHPKLANLEPPDTFGVIHAAKTIRHYALVRTQVNTSCSWRVPIAQAEAHPFP